MQAPKDIIQDPEYWPVTIAGLNIGKKPATKMGVKPRLADIQRGFVDPSYGPPRGTFWNGEDLKQYRVVCAEGPQEFYIENPDGQKELEDLELKMMEVYDEHWKTNSAMKKDDLVVGGFYAFYSKKYETWYRCRVEDVILTGDVNAKDEVVLQFLDYGTREIATLDLIYKLRPEFLELETQVTRVSLFNNTEDEGAMTWTPEECAEFNKTVRGKIIRGYVADVEQVPDETFIHIQMVIFNKDGSILMGSRLNLDKAVEAGEGQTEEAEAEPKVKGTGLDVEAAGNPA